MSISSIGSPQIFTAPFTLVNGVLVPVTTANFNGSCKVLSVERIGAPAGVTPGVPGVAVVGPTGSGAAAATHKLGIYDSTVLDNSTYTVTWANYYTPSDDYTQGVVAGVVAPFVANQQYAA